jgi:hypothetical protein
MAAIPARSARRPAARRSGGLGPGRPGCSGDEFVVEFDLPGVSPDSVDLDVERNVLTVRPNARPLTVTGS